MEWITTAILLRFVNEFCEYYQAPKMIYKLSLPIFWEEFTLHVIPMLNPDGVDYQIHGVCEENPLRTRVIDMNGGSEDFSHWQANARGVDLNHNYDAGFEKYKRIEEENNISQGAPTRYSGEAPESEPETTALCNWIRFHTELCGVMTLHTQGEEIFYKSQGKVPCESERIVQRLATLSGYRPSEAEGLASFGGLSDWCIQELSLPSFTLECGKGKNPLPIDSFFGIWARLRELFFTFPILV
jgi:g-D-glutamyl-meso-diaminopimelate peptidase